MQKVQLRYKQVSEIPEGTQESQVGPRMDENPDLPAFQEMRERIIQRQAQVRATVEELSETQDSAEERAQWSRYLEQNGIKEHLVQR